MRASHDDRQAVVVEKYRRTHSVSLYGNRPSLRIVSIHHLVAHIRAMHRKHRECVEFCRITKEPDMGIGMSVGSFAILR